MKNHSALCRAGRLAASCALAALSFAAVDARAQIAYAGGTLAQDFNTLPSTSTTTWTNNVTLPGWYAWRVGVNAAPGNVMPNDGSGTAAARVQSYGVAGNSQRSIGLLPDATTGNVQLAVRLTNTTRSSEPGLALGFGARPLA